jgi:hypothetical protein
MRRQQAVDLMVGFASRTGVTTDVAPRCYLWTDAFAVCNFLGLCRATGEGRYDELALRLVERVHRTLGRHRDDDVRRGWISGASANDGEAHPTRGGLRIGKPMPERGPTDPFDERLEWERDGQYFHYLTRWMHALDQVALATRQSMFNVWARELAHAAHLAFTHDGRMYWKMSIDLSRPLVASMGQHDPLDGYVTCLELDATAETMGWRAAGPRLDAEAADFSSMIDERALATGDPLGLGGLLVDAYCVELVLRQGAPPGGALRLQGALLDAALAGARVYVAQPDLRSPVSRRLAFRELGLAIGLAAVERMRADVDLAGGPDTRARIERLAEVAPVRAEIESFWLQPEHRRARTWLAHEDINDVMLATSLAPEGFLGVGG